MAIEIELNNIYITFVRIHHKHQQFFLYINNYKHYFYHISIMIFTITDVRVKMPGKFCSWVLEIESD